MLPAPVGAYHGVGTLLFPRCLSSALFIMYCSGISVLGIGVTPRSSTVIRTRHCFAPSGIETPTKPILVPLVRDISPCLPPAPMPSKSASTHPSCEPRREHRLSIPGDDLCILSCCDLVRKHTLPVPYRGSMLTLCTEAKSSHPLRSVTLTNLADSSLT